MTSSHLQFFKIGPVAPVAKKMGVSNIRLLHHHREQNPTYNNQLKTARRSLWGSPEPGEIKKLSIERAQTDRNYMIKRYSYDIFTEKFVNDNETEGLDAESNNNNQQNNENNNNNNNNSVNNNKISINNNNNNNNNNSNNNNKNIDNSNNSFKDNFLEQQLQQQNSVIVERLSGGEQTEENHSLIINCNKSEILNNELCNNEINVPTTGGSSSIKITTKPVITQIIMPTTPSGILLLKDKKFGSGGERIKPYSTKRQNLITEYFSTRKTISTSDAPVPQKAKLLDNETLCELKQQQQQQESQNV